MEQTSDLTSDLEIKRAAQLSLTEISVGSIGHGFKIPLTGQVLSLNQLGFLLNALNRDQLPRFSVFEISGIAAILKSFSPAGQKLGPMLSIAMQGFLFWFGTALVGVNIFGQLLGAVLLSLWAFIQPLITLTFIYGLDLPKLYEFYFQKISDDYSFIAMALIYSFLLVLIVKIILALTITVLSHQFKKEIKIIKPDKINNLAKLADRNPQNSTLRAVLKDMLRPLFIISFVLLLVFIWHANSSYSQKIWMGLRPLALAFIIFYLIRSPWIAQKLINYSKKSSRFEKIYLKAQKAYQQIKANKP